MASPQAGGGAGGVGGAGGAAGSGGAGGGGASGSPYGSSFQIGVQQGGAPQGAGPAAPPGGTVEMGAPGSMPMSYSTNPGMGAPGTGMPGVGAPGMGAPGMGSPYGSSAYPSMGGGMPLMPGAMGGGMAPPMGAPMAYGSGYPAPVGGMPGMAGAMPPPLGGAYGSAYGGGGGAYPPSPYGGGGAYPPSYGANPYGMPHPMGAGAYPPAVGASPYGQGGGAPPGGAYPPAPGADPYATGGYPSGSGLPPGEAPGYGMSGGMAAPEGAAVPVGDARGEGNPYGAPYPGAVPPDGNKGGMSTAGKVALAGAAGVGGVALLGGAALIGYFVYKHYTQKGATLSPGDSIDVPNSDRLRVILNWVTTKKVPAGAEDLDLSAVAFDEDLDQQALCYYDKKRELYGACTLSEDVQKAKGLDEIITVNLVKCDDLEVKYLVFNVTSFKGVPFSKFKEATIRMQDADGSLIFRFSLENIGNHTAASLGRLIRTEKGKWIFQAFGLPLDGVVPHKLHRFYPWLYTEEFVRFPNNMYIYLIGGRDLTAMDSNGKSDPWAEMGLVEVPEQKQSQFRVVTAELVAFLNEKMRDKGWIKTKKDLIVEKNVKQSDGVYLLPMRTEWLAQRVSSLSGIKFEASNGNRLDMTIKPVHESLIVACSPRKKTDVKKKTLSPKWKECLVLEVPMRFYLDDHMGYIEIRVFDQDGFFSKSHESMGFLRIPFYSAFQEALGRRKKGDKEYSTEAREYEMNKGSGFIKVKVGFQKPAEDCGFQLK